MYPEKYTHSRGSYQQIMNLKRNSSNSFFPEIKKKNRRIVPILKWEIKFAEAKIAADYSNTGDDQVRSIDILNSISREIPPDIKLEIKNVKHR